MSLLDEERQKYEEVWAMPSYRVANHGLKMWTNHRDLYPDHVRTAIDIGCGNGRLVGNLRREGIDAWGIDFAANAPDSAWRGFVVMGCLWDQWPLVPSLIGEKFDVGNCTDVMEHILRLKWLTTCSRTSLRAVLSRSSRSPITSLASATASFT